MKNEAVVCNSGHFDVEIDLKGLAKMAKSVRQTREFVQEYTISKNQRINVLAGGRLINLSAAEGHPASVMDMSFANQALCSEWVAKNYKKLKKQVYTVPEAIDESVAAMKLKTMGVKIDKLTEEQKKYLASWSMGT
jgi:adenosylhomocysteinase